MASFPKTNIGYKLCVSIFSTTFVWNIPHAENSGKYNHICALLFMFSAVILVRFYWNFNFLCGFSRNSQISNFRKCVQREPTYSLTTDGRTDRHDEVNSVFRSFTNGAKKLKFHGESMKAYVGAQLYCTAILIPSFGNRSRWSRIQVPIHIQLSFSWLHSDSYALLLKPDVAKIYFRMLYFPTNELNSEKSLNRQKPIKLIKATPTCRYRRCQCHGGICRNNTDNLCLLGRASLW